MKYRDTQKRHEELAQIAGKIGANLPAYPTPEELAPVVRALMLQTRCMRASAHQAIVAGVLRPKRQAARNNADAAGSILNENR